MSEATVPRLRDVEGGLPTSVGVALRLLVATLFLVVYARPLLYVVRSPFGYPALYGVLVLGISGYLAWTKKGALRRVHMHPGFVSGPSVVAFSFALLFLGASSGTPLVEGLSLPVGVLGFCLLLCGTEFTRLLLIPILYLVFLFPLFDKVLTAYTASLEGVAVLVAHGVLGLMGIPHLRDGSFIELPHITLQVVQACNGINHVVALVALGLIVVDRSRWRFAVRVFFLLGLIGVALLANGLRIALIAIWTRHFGTASFHGPFNIFYSSFVFFVGVGFIMLVDHISPRRRAADPDGSVAQDRVSGFNKNMGGLSPVALLAAVAVLSAAVSLKAFGGTPVHPVEVSLETLPFDFAMLAGRAAAPSRESFEEGQFDATLSRTYVDPAGSLLRVFIGYLSSQGPDKEIHKYPLNVAFSAAEHDTIPMRGGKQLRVNVARANGRRVYYWYNIDGRNTANRYVAKAWSMLNTIIKKRSNAAVIVVAESQAGTIENSGGSGAPLPDAAAELVDNILAVLAGTHLRDVGQVAAPHL